MRDSALFEVTLRRFGVWRAAVAVVGAAAVALPLAWAAATLASGPTTGTITVLLGAVVLATGAAVLAVSLARVDGGVLSMHAGRWTFSPASGQPAESGSLAVKFDLGGFMMLRFAGAGNGGRRRWLPVQRTGLEREWHALRCAVYSPPPSAGAPAAADLPRTE